MAANGREHSVDTTCASVSKDGLDIAASPAQRFPVLRPGLPVRALSISSLGGRYRVPASVGLAFDSVAFAIGWDYRERHGRGVCEDSNAWPVDLRAGD